jgi:tight adherence protein C
LSAGLSFDASLELYCKRYDTDLSKTMRGTLQLWRIGVKSRAEALEEMARELDAPAMTRFVATVSEALAFGTPLAETLERQAQVIREEQRAQMEEEVEKVPVKMLIPLGTLIVPAMLLAILGPLLGPALGLA